MSNGENENSNESENPVEVENSKETENTKQTAEAAKNTAGNILASLMTLKESNPKVFFGGIGAVVLVLVIIMMMTGGSKKNLPVHQAAVINIGQNYILKGANVSAPEATIRLVALPGSTAAYDDTEKDDRVGGCKHMPQGTPVKVLQTQDAFGKKDAFVQVEMTSGECQGQRGWVLAINIQ